MNLFYMFYLSYKSILNVVIRFAIHTLYKNIQNNTQNPHLIL